MLTDRYTRAIALTAGLAVLLVAVFSQILLNSGPRVRFVSFDSNIDSTFLTEGSVATIHFDRPLENRSYTQDIKIAPEVAASYRTTGNSILIRFDENLAHQTTYTITIDPSIVDTTGKRMKTRFDYQFTTPAPRYAFLERNYAADTAADTAQDRIVVGQSGTEPRTVFSHPQIRSFAANARYVVTAVIDDTKDRLMVIDLQSGETQEIELLFGGRIENLSLSNRGSVALFGVHPDISSVSETYYENYAQRVNALNLETGEVTLLTNAQDEPLRATEIFIDSSGALALIQDPAQSFLAISPYNDYDPVVLGSFDATYGTANRGSELLFRDNERFVRYDVEDPDFTVIDWGVDGFIRKIAVADENRIFASLISSTAGSARESIYRFRGWADQKPVTVWQEASDSSETLRNFAISHDGGLLALQLEPNTCRDDGIGHNSQCPETRTVIYDTQSAEIVEEFGGFDIVWLP